MKKTPQVLWAEGMFLRPHHLQTAERYREEALQREIQRLQPFYLRPSVAGRGAGPARELRLRDPRRLPQAEGRHRAVVRLHAPALAEELQERARQGERPDAGLRRRPGDAGDGSEHLRPGRGAGRCRPALHRRERRGPRRELGRQPAARRRERCNGKLFFGAESQEGYECLEVAVVERSGSGRNFPVLSREFIPSLTELGGSRTIQALCDGVTNRIEAKHRLLLTDVSQGRLTIQSEGTSGWQTIIKLQILGSFLFLFQQLTRIPRIHPFAVYTEFARLAGELSIFDDGKIPVKIPVYDHEKLGPCFHETCRVIEALLEKIVASRFVKVDFVLRDDLLVADLLEEWLAAQTEVFLAIEAEMEEKDLRGRIVTMKLGTVRDIPILRQRRLFGLDLELLKRTPAGLPQREDYFYFKIEKEGPYWANVVRDRNVALSDALDPKLKFSLYIITKPGS